MGEFMVVLLPCYTEYQARWRIQKLTPVIRALKFHCASQGAALRIHRTLSSLSVTCCCPLRQDRHLKKESEEKPGGS